MEDLDNFDLYNDLDDFQEQQDKKCKEVQGLEEQLAAAEQNIEQLKIQKKQLCKKLKTMEINFQNLLDTAKSEIRRKDQLIAQLRQEKDDICFRRQRPHAENKHVNNCEQQDQYVKNIGAHAQKEAVAQEIQKDSRECVERLTDTVVSEHIRNNQREHRSRRELSREREQHNNRGRNRSRERAKSRERTTRDKRERSPQRTRSHGSRDKSKDWRRNRDKDQLIESKYRSKVNHERRSSRDQKRDSEGEEKRYRGTKRERSRSRERKNVTDNSERAARDTKRSKMNEKSVDKKGRLEDKNSNNGKKKQNALNNEATVCNQQQNNKNNSAQIEENKFENCIKSENDNCKEKETSKKLETLQVEKEKISVEINANFEIEQPNAFSDYLELFAETDISDAGSPDYTPIKSTKAELNEQVYDFIESDEEFQFCEQSPSKIEEKLIAISKKLEEENNIRMENGIKEVQIENGEKEKLILNNNKLKEIEDCTLMNSFHNVEENIMKASTTTTTVEVLRETCENSSPREKLKTKAMCKNYDNDQQNIEVLEELKINSIEIIVNTSKDDALLSSSTNMEVNLLNAAETLEKTKSELENTCEITLPNGNETNALIAENNEKTLNTEISSNAADEIILEENNMFENQELIIVENIENEKEDTNTTPDEPINVIGNHNWGSFKIPKKPKALNKSIEIKTMENVEKLKDTVDENAINAETQIIIENANENKIADKMRNSLVEDIFDKSNEETEIHLCSPKSIDREIDSCMSLMFESPQHNNFTNLTKTTPNVPENITIEEERQNASITTNESTLNSSTETKHLVMGSTDYVFEKVSDNVINIFITRRKNKKKKLAKLTKPITT